MPPPPPQSPLFPYTTLFRSLHLGEQPRTNLTIVDTLKQLAAPADFSPARNQRRLQTRARSVVRILTGRHVHAFGDRKSTRLNSSHPSISYAVFCLKKKNTRD